MVRAQGRESWARRLTLKDFATLAGSQGPHCQPRHDFLAPAKEPRLQEARREHGGGGDGGEWQSPHPVKGLSVS